jgi:uncharacterized protein (DUF4415 family)
MGMVSYTIDTLPLVNKKELDMVAALKDEEIDCSDIPEIKTLSGLRPKPAKIAITCKLDADIVEWLKQEGDSYQTRVNSILRQAMANAL